MFTTTMFSSWPPMPPPSPTATKTAPKSSATPAFGMAPRTAPTKASPAKMVKGFAR